MSLDNTVPTFQGLGAHHIRLTLQSRVIIHLHPILHLQRRPHPPLGLLHHMPRLVRKVVLLHRRQMNVTALGIGQRVELRRLR